jgi:hypothetical protein
MSMLGLVIALTLSIGQRRQPQPLENLKQLGERIVRAVLEQDTDTLKAYDWSGTGSISETALDDPRSALHCYVFDSRCNPPGKPSVLEMFSKWRKVSIQATSAGSNYAVLFFYDAAVVSARGLRSQKTLCREAGRRIVSWVFRFESGRWVAANDAFDFDVDTLCDGKAAR